MIYYPACLCYYTPYCDGPGVCGCACHKGQPDEKPATLQPHDESDQEFYLRTSEPSPANAAQRPLYYPHVGFDWLKYAEKLEAENAALRQQVERLTAERTKLYAAFGWPGDLLHALTEKFAAKKIEREQAIAQAVADERRAACLRLEDAFRNGGERDLPGLALLRYQAAIRAGKAAREVWDDIPTD